MELNPQQIEFLVAYTNPRSPTWGNALQSALKAKYSQEYAETITAQMPEWLSENLGKNKLVQKAEKNLDKALEGGLDAQGEGKKEIQWKATEMTLKTLKKVDYSERTEVTGPNGTELKGITIVKNYASNDQSPS